MGTNTNDVDNSYSMGGDSYDSCRGLLFWRDENAIFIGGDVV